MEDNLLKKNIFNGDSYFIEKYLFKRRVYISYIVVLYGGRFSNQPKACLFLD